MEGEQKRMIAKASQEVEIVHITCDLGVRHWEDGELDGVEDSADDPKMPCVYTDEWGERRWLLEIDPKTGKIENWDKGHTANVCYKICDDCDITYYTEVGSKCKVNSYVPSFLAPEEMNYGDYAIMHINEEGYIRNWGARGDLKCDLTDEIIESI